VWIISYYNRAKHDFKLIKRNKHLRETVSSIIDELKNDPFNNSGNMERLRGYGDKLIYSKRITLKHRLVYEVLKDTKEVIVHSMWSHYE